MSESSQRPDPDGSSRAVLETRVDKAYAAIMHHLNGDENTPYCEACRTGGVDCETAYGLKLEWREAKLAARPPRFPRRHGSY